MLVLSRKRRQWVRFGDDILVTVVAISGTRVRLGFLAPVGTDILRSELTGRDVAAGLGGDTEASGFLVLTRKVGESIRIGNDITLTVLKVFTSRVSMGIEAPANVHVLRGEINDAA